MTLFLSIILWAVLLPILPILYFMQKNECKPKKNIIAGVTLPYEAQGDAEVLTLLERYGRELKRMCWVMLAAVVPGVARRMAETLPPKQPPLKAPRHMTMAWVGVR